MKTYKTRPFNRDASPAQVAALELQLSGLRALEQTPLYQQMCAAADARVRAGGDYAHGWGEFSANGDPRKRRKAAV